MSSVVANFALLNKIYIPKYIFPLEKCLFVEINCLLTLIPLYLVIIFTGTGLCIWHILLPFVVLCLFMFTFGMDLYELQYQFFERYVLYLWNYYYDMDVFNANYACL